MAEACVEVREFSLAAAPGPAPIRLLKSSVLRGCNIHHRGTVIRQEVDLGCMQGLCSGEAGPEFAQRFLDRFLELRRMIPGGGMAESFLERLNSPRGAPVEEVLLEAVAAVETAMAFAMHNLARIGFAEIVHGGSPQQVFLVWECGVPKLSRRAAAVGLAGLVELLPAALHPRRDDTSKDFSTVLAALENQARRRERSTTAAVLALAAKTRGVPCENLRGPFLRVGHGASQRVIYASVTPNTSLAASQLSRNKHMTNLRLEELRLPVARQIRVTSAGDALIAANTIGYPVVIKPLKEKQASGVSVGIRSPEEVFPAFERARTGKSVIVESYVPGQVYRLLVIGGRFVAALKTVPPTVTGDGSRTVEELIRELNHDPLRNGVRLFKVNVDEELIRDLDLSGCSLGSVLEKGNAIAVRAAANVAIGGVHTDVTESVHPDNQQMAVRAAAGIGLDVAGIDFVTEDISRSYRDAGGSIIEVNARPGLCMHTLPRYGKGRDVGGAVLELLFPPGVNGRIPTILVAGDRKTARIARDVEAILRASGRTAGLVTRKHSYIAGEPAEIQKSRQWNAGRILLRDPRVEMLVSTVSLRRTVRRGLVLDTCDVAAITGPADRKAEGLYQQGVEVVVNATHGMLAVSAKNKPALEVMRTLDPKRVILLSSNVDDPAVVSHISAGGVVVFKVRKQHQVWVALYCNGKAIVSIPVTAPPPGADPRRMESRMFAVALAFGIGISGSDIEAAA